MMKFTIAQPLLNRALSLVSHVVPTRGPLPILSQVLFTATDDGRIRLTATNLETSIHAWCTAQEISQAGTTLLPAKVFTEFVRDLPNAPVTITRSEDVPRCDIRCLSIKTGIQLGTEKPDEFPQVASFEQERSQGQYLLLLDGTLLKEIIDQVAFAAASDESRPVFTGVHLTIGNGKAVFAASNTFRLAVRTIPIPDEELRSELIIPADTLHELASHLPAEGTVQMLLTAKRNQVVFHCEHFDLVSRLLDGTYPNIERVLPQTYATRAIVCTADLTAALKLALPFAREDGNTVRLTFQGAAPASSNRMRSEPQTVKIEAAARDVGECEQFVPVLEVSGPSQTLLLNGRHLTDVLATLPAQEVAFEMTSPTAAIAIKPIGLMDYIYILMPLTIRESRTESATATSTQPATTPTPATVAR